MIEYSIIIPVRNQKETLLMILSSLKKQIKKPRVFEIVVGDDGSEDGTDAAVKKMRYPIFFKYFRNDPPLGRAANRNLGFEKSSGQHLIFLDGDMVPESSFIEAMLGDSDVVRLGMPKPPPQQEHDRIDRYLYSRGRYDRSRRGMFLPGRFFTSNSFYISRPNFEKIGRFDTNFKGWGGEDIDFGLRLEANNIPIINIPEAVTYHYHKRTVGSLVRDFYDFGRYSFAYLINKHPAFLRQIPAHRLGLSEGKTKAEFFFKILSRLTINRPALKITEIMMSALINYALPDFLFDYVIWGNLALGYRKRSIDRQ